MCNGLENRPGAGRYEDAEKHARNIADSYLQGYREGREGEPFKFDIIHLRGK